MSKTDKQLLDLKEFTFGGDTGRTLSDLYEAVNTIGGTKDAPFVMPLWLEGNERPAAVNSYLGSDGKRFHIIWCSDNSGLSHVVDVIFDAPSLAKEKKTNSCETCSIGISGIMEELGKDV